MSDVLIVDDEDSICTALASGLEHSGAICDCAGSGREALVKLCERTAAGQVYDAVVLDIALPDVDGWSVLRAIRANPLWQDMRVIVLTGQATTTRDMARATQHDALFVEKTEGFFVVVADLVERFVVG